MEANHGVTMRNAVVSRLCVFSPIVRTAWVLSVRSLRQLPACLKLCAISLAASYDSDPRRPTVRAYGSFQSIGGPVQPGVVSACGLLTLHNSNFAHAPHLGALFISERSGGHTQHNPERNAHSALRARAC